MTHALLWIESMAAAILWCAAWRTAARQPVAPIVRIFANAVALLPLLPGVGMVVASAWLIDAGIAGNAMPFSASWLLVLVPGMVWVWRRTGRNSTSTWSLQWVGTTAAGAIAIAVLTFWIIDSRVRGQLALVRAEATALSLSTAPGRVPDAQNAALVYEQAIESYVDVEDRSAIDDATDAWLDDASKPMPTTAEATAWLAQNAGVVNLLHRAAERPGCYFERDYARLGFNTPIPEVLPMIQFSRLLTLDVAGHVAAGESRQAARSLHTMMMMAHHLSSDPILISMLVGHAIGGRTFVLVPRVLAMPGLTDDDLALLEPPVGYANGRHALQRALLGEEAFGLSVFAMMGEGEATYDSLISEVGLSSSRQTLRSWMWSVVTPVWRVLLLGDDLRGYREFMASNRSVADEAFSTEATRKAMAGLEERATLLATQSPGFLTGLVAPSIAPIHRSVAGSDAQARMLQVGVAIERYRLAHDGALPDTLAALMPEFLPAVPLDTFDGKPLRYVKTDSGYTLYSVSENLTDDGGTKGENRQSGDLVMSVRH